MSKTPLHSFLSQVRKLLIIIALLLVSATNSASSTDDSDKFPYYYCPDTYFSYSLDSEFQNNLNYTLSTRLLTSSLQNESSTFTNGTGVDQVYALYYCRGDAEISTCHQCIQTAVSKIAEVCKLKKQAMIWYEDCTLLYSNISLSFDDDIQPKLHYNRTSLVSEPRLDPYKKQFNSLMNDLIIKVANTRNPVGFATNETNLTLSGTLRGLAQCNPYVNNTYCENCLIAALRDMDGWATTMVFLPNCQIRYYLYGELVLPSSVRPTKPVIKIVLGVVFPVVIILLVLVGLWFLKHRPPSENKKHNIEEAKLQLERFTYKQVRGMTNEFERILGEGGYGIVYHGRLRKNNKEAAIKVLSKDDAPTQFSNEIKVLGKIHHKNLVSLIGYCEEGPKKLALVYEYMSGGDLKSLMSERSDIIVSWKRRLAIAFDTAQGLDYLHNGCNPPIVHRDVKPANILLNQHLQAKVADFGFSKIFPAEYVSTTTRVIGTPGYVDPQYHLTGQVNEIIDVYSFGVLLLELITGKTAIINSTGTNLVQWVTPLYEQCDIGNILDPRLWPEIGDNYNTVWKVTELAKKCVASQQADRPTMSDIVTELRECLPRENVDGAGTSSSAATSMEMSAAVISTSSMSPQPR